MKKTVALHNLGCKVNAYELEAIQQLLENRGYEIVPFAPGADVYIINTCTVTNIADRKSRQMLHKAKKMNPDAVVVACGCYVQAAGEKLEEDTAIDLIIGNNKKKDLVDILENFLAEREDGGKPSDAECKSFLVDMTHNREYETLSISKTAEHTRAFLKVQDGCNQFCTYCIIPYARGRVRSRRQSDVVEEVKRLAEAGYQEVVLTGIHLSSYGLDFPEGEKETLLDLIRAVDAVDGITFEKIIEALYKKAGMLSVRTSESNDNGADVTVFSGSKQPNLLIQCKKTKNYQSNIGKDGVQEIKTALSFLLK